MAAALGYTYLDTGAMYRSVAWKALRTAADPTREEAMEEVARRLTIRFTPLTPDGNDWKLFSLHTATGAQDAEPEDRFTLVGKGVGFNDVYHQPMPDPKQLADLVHATMAGFNSARGISASILGDLLIHDATGHRTSLVVPSLPQLAEDPAGRHLLRQCS